MHYEVKYWYLMEGIRTTDVLCRKRMAGQLCLNNCSTVVAETWRSMGPGSQPGRA